ncbi:unnamed protein product [Soboliphyme baturini]|uniref:Zinc finger CCCH domain-containing protein 10 n=1 Tax=Soboliphyme baturini TaxID=241478 RepID=A0A183IJ87_9BILA|nr:unnamed protein product [Soboliphyme baturini]
MSHVKQCELILVLRNVLAEGIKMSLEANGVENVVAGSVKQQQQEQQPRQQQEEVSVATTGKTDDRNVCRDFLNNVCFRGSRCKYYHPPELVAKYDQLRKEDKYVHCCSEDKEEYERHGKVTESLARAIVAATGQEIVDGRPLCKEYLSGHCSRGSRCRFWHINPRHEREVLLQRSLCTPCSSLHSSALSDDVHQQVYLRPTAAAPVAAPPYSNFVYGYFGEYRCPPSPALGNRKRLRPYSYNGGAFPAFTVVSSLGGSVGSGHDTSDSYAALLEENVSLRRRVDLLKQSLTDLTTQNDQLLAEVARLRAKLTAANVSDPNRV